MSEGTPDVGASRPPAWLVPALAVAAGIYGAGARLHRRFARWTAPARGRPSCAVLSVGGLTVGGAGKTPVAAWLARALQRRGWRVVLASRGYKGAHRRRVEIVSDGEHVRSSVAISGDESLVLAAHAPGVPVLVGRDRRIVGHHAVSVFDADILVLDDGFQHHRLARDLDVVCVDGDAGFGNGHVLPWGPLREPASALRHADWLCVVDGDASGWPEPVRRWQARGRPLLRAWRVPSALASLERREPRPVRDLAGRSVGLLAGVGRPGSVRRSLEGLGARIVAERIFPDHHAYRESDLRSLDDAPDLWITTEKDALKILPAWIGERPLRVLEIALHVDDEEAALDRLEADLIARRPGLASRRGPAEPARGSAGPGGRDGRVRERP